MHARYELPAFSTLRRAAQKARAQVNHRYYHQVADALNDLQRLTLTRLLSREEREATSAWQRLKQEPSNRLPTDPRAFGACPVVAILDDGVPGSGWGPETKLQRFAEEARASNVARMNALPEPKRYTLAVALIRVRTAQALDDLVEMFLRRLQKLHQQAKEALAAYRDQHQEQTDALVALLGHIVGGWLASDPQSSSVRPSMP